ncbi:hypothetical protein [Microvirga zambiensis]|uniref:hypothetical protein n=1 Tax=Microvirga zambiensis TaxID=1402137 RepID=UPI00191D208C|nr:hypothetical protein [Microvirga zambiensis]
MFFHKLDKAEGYRRQAQEVRDVAKQITLLDAKRQLLATAQHLETLAEEEERKARASATRQDKA